MDNMAIGEPNLRVVNVGSALNLEAIAEQPAANEGWRFGLPVLNGTTLTLRELRASDAAALVSALSSREVARFISPPPTTVAGFERFIAWTHRERAAGNYVCFGIVPHGLTAAVGLFQVRQLDAGFSTAEWGFALGSGYWGTGAFMEGARLIMDFVFETMGVLRLEARAAVQNGRGNGALRKIGARHEGVLRKSFLRNREYLDQNLWAILEEDWQRTRSFWGVRVH